MYSTAIAKIHSIIKFNLSIKIIKEMRVLFFIVFRGKIPKINLINKKERKYGKHKIVLQQENSSTVSRVCYACSYTACECIRSRKNVTPSDITQFSRTNSVVTPTDLTSQVTRDVVLLLDVSGSMSGTPITTMKKAAQKFCSQLLEADGKNRVAIIAFQSSYSTCNFTSDLNTLSSFINSKSASGGTNMNAAAQAAASLLSNSSADIKNVVIMADGLPQSGATVTNGHYSSGSNYKYANAVYNTVKAYDESYNVYTLGFFHSISGSTKDFASKFMSDLAGGPKGTYTEVTNVDDLEFAFGEVAEDITKEDIEFHYASGTKTDYVGICHYSDSYFYKDSCGKEELD